MLPRFSFIMTDICVRHSLAPFDPQPWRQPCQRCGTEAFLTSQLKSGLSRVWINKWLSGFHFGENFFFLYAYFSGNLPICLEVILKINIIALIPSLKCFLKTSEWIILLSCCSCVRPCATPQTAAHQAPPSLGFSRQEHWSGLPFPSPMHESEKSKRSRSLVSDS